MTLSGTIGKIKDTMPSDRVLTDEPMSRHTSFRIGGPADAFVMVHNDYELASVLRLVNEGGAEHMLIGNGSNLLVADEGYRGIMIKLDGEFGAIHQNRMDPRIVRAGAACLMSRVASYLTDAGLAGFEFASGIPGSIGGAVFMNAGAYGGEMKDVVSSVRVMIRKDRGGRFDTEVVTLSSSDMDFSYRHSRAEEEDLLILAAEMKFTPDDPEAIAARVSELQSKRNSKQPVNYPSAGSTFKRPVGGYAAALIEQSGLKGFTAGGAQVSEKHSGFVINAGGASCADVLDVMRHVRETVYRDSGIVLEPEVRLINCEL